MLNVSDTLRANLESFDIKTNVLVKIDFSTPILYTDSPSDITYNGDTYISGPITGVSPPKAEGQINRDVFDISFDDPDYTIEQMLINDPSGVPSEVNIMIGDEFLPLYKGRTSNFVSAIRDGDQGIQNEVTVTSTGPLAKLYQVSNRTTTEASQKNIHANDNAFDYSYDTQNNATLKWGGTS